MGGGWDKLPAGAEGVHMRSRIEDTLDGFPRIDASIEQALDQTLYKQWKWLVPPAQS